LGYNVRSKHEIDIWVSHRSISLQKHIVACSIANRYS
jgi:hypothetical protein